jgi:hypothetical protein
MSDPMKDPLWYVNKYKPSDALPTIQNLTSRVHELEAELADLRRTHVKLEGIDVEEWCAVHRSGFNWHNNGPRCDAHRLMATPGYSVDIQPCEMQLVKVLAALDGETS